MNVSVWPRKFAERLMKAKRKEMDDRDLAEYHPSHQSLDLVKEDDYKALQKSAQPPEVGGKSVGRINNHNGKNYTKVTTGQIKAKNSDFILDLDDFEEFLKNKGHSNRTAENLMRILFTSLTNESFGQSKYTVDTKKTMINNLESYYVHEVILGKAVMKD